MATRSRIGIEDENGKVRAIYCHFDGYVDHNGHILEEHYTDRDKINQLIDLGSISVLGTTPIENPNGEYDPDSIYTKPHNKSSPFIYNYENQSDYFYSPDSQEYNYLFTKNNEWFVNHPVSGQICPVNVFKSPW